MGHDLLAYVGCVAGAIPIDEYVRGLREAGFDAVKVVDTKKDLNAYSKVEGQSGCCGPATESQPKKETACRTPAPEGSSACCTPKPDAKEAMGSGCCTPAPAGSSACCTTSPTPGQTVHGGLAELLSKYDVNEFAAGVQVYAVKGS